MAERSHISAIVIYHEPESPPPIMQLQLLAATTCCAREFRVACAPAASYDKRVTSWVYTYGRCNGSHVSK